MIGRNRLVRRGPRRGETLKGLAKRLKLSNERVRQIEVEGLGKIRRFLSPSLPVFQEEGEKGEKRTCEVVFTWK